MPIVGLYRPHAHQSMPCQVDVRALCDISRSSKTQAVWRTLTSWSSALNTSNKYIYYIYIYWWWQVKAPTLKLGAHFGSGSPTDARSHITLWRLAAPPATKGLAGSPCSEYAKLLMPRAEFSAQDGKILRAKAMATNSCCWKLRCSPEIGASNSHQVGWVCLLALAGEYVPFLHVPNSATVRIHDFVDQALQGEPS